MTVARKRQSPQQSRLKNIVTPRDSGERCEVKRDWSLDDSATIKILENILPAKSPKARKSPSRKFKSEEVVIPPSP